MKRMWHRRAALRIALTLGSASWLSAATSTVPAEGAPHAASMPAETSRPAAATSQPIVREITLAGPESPTSYWLRLPAGYRPGDRPPLAILLHGTDDTARDMIDFWTARTWPIPAILAAPQGMAQGWSDRDIPAIRRMLDDLPRQAAYDEQRVLFAGFSAGGAMAFQLLYAEKLPVTAVVAMANYVPPPLTADQVADRRYVPVFYAVGMADINYERMRVGIEFLRGAGANVSLYRPRIGHQLEPAVTQAGLDWFFDTCRQEVAARIEAASGDEILARGVAILERLVDQRRWHEPAQVAEAEQVLDRLRTEGERKLREVEQLVAVGRQVAAVEMLQEVESQYGGTHLGQQARQQREQLEADPAVREQVALRAIQKRADEAMDLYAAAQRLVANRQFTEAADQCRRIVQIYGDTPAAKRAEHLLGLLDKRSQP